MVAYVQSHRVWDQFQDHREEIFVDFLSLETQGTTIRPDDAVFDQHLLFHLLGLFLRQQFLPLLTLLLLLPGLQLLSQALDFLLQLRDLDYLVANFLLALQ